MTNLMPDDRKAAMAVIDDDVKFDAWMNNYAAKQGASDGKGSIDQDTFINRHAKVHGGG